VKKSTIAAVAISAILGPIGSSGAAETGNAKPNLLDSNNYACAGLSRMLATTQSKKGPSTVRKTAIAAGVLLALGWVAYDNKLITITPNPPHFDLTLSLDCRGIEATDKNHDADGKVTHGDNAEIFAHSQELTVERMFQELEARNAWIRLARRQRGPAGILTSPLSTRNGGRAGRGSS
jgi:hypothetical protein